MHNIHTIKIYFIFACLFLLAIIFIRDNYRSEIHSHKMEEYKSAPSDLVGTWKNGNMIIKISSTVGGLHASQYFMTDTYKEKINEGNLLQTEKNEFRLENFFILECKSPNTLLYQTNKKNVELNKI